MLKLFRFLKYKYIKNYKLDFFRVRRKDIELSRYRGKRNYIFGKWITFHNNYRNFKRRYVVPRFIYKKKLNLRKDFY